MNVAAARRRRCLYSTSNLFFYINFQISMLFRCLQSSSNFFFTSTFKFQCFFNAYKALQTYFLHQLHHFALLGRHRTLMYFTAQYIAFHHCIAHYCLGIFSLSGWLCFKRDLAVVIHWVFEIQNRECAMQTNTCKRPSRDLAILIGCVFEIQNTEYAMQKIPASDHQGILQLWYIVSSNLEL